jgi:pyruvate carboxylase subunit B
MPTPSDPQYRALVGDHAFDIDFREGDLLLDGKPVDYSFEAVSEGYYTLLVDGHTYPVVIEPLSQDRVRVTLRGRQIEVQIKNQRALLLERFGLEDAGAAAQREVRAPMPGLVLRVLVEPGQEVQAGDGLVVLEAMKMENELRAQAPGTIAAIHAAPGDAVSKNALLLEIDA